MSLVLRSVVVLAFAGGAMSASAPVMATHSEDVALDALVDTGAVECESSMDEPLYGMAANPEPDAFWGYCLSDCSRCATREDCVSPEFPNGITCTAIKLCLADTAH